MSFIPLATNSLNALGTFKQRDFYDKNVYPRVAPIPIDLWYDKPLYGKVDKRNNSVYPSEAFLKQFKISEKTIFALNFVVDAFEDFKIAFETFVERGKIQTTNTELLEMTPDKSWESVNGFYHEYISILYTVFSETFIQDGVRNEKILDFSSFVKVFIEFIDSITPLYPFSKTGFITSKYCPPSISGLVIKIKRENHSEDQNKFDKYLDDGNFTFYARLARNHGFVVDKNAPWVLVADLDSPAMLPYFEKNETDLDNLFQDFYYRSFELDVEIIKIYLLQYYNSLVSASPTIRVSKKGRGIRGAVTEIKHRKQISMEQLDKMFPFSFWLRMYAYIRAREIEKTMTQNQFEQIIKQSIEISKFVDQLSAIDFINQKFRGQPPISIERNSSVSQKQTNLTDRKHDFTFI